MIIQYTYEDGIRDYIALYKEEELAIVCHPSNIDKFKNFPELKIIPKNDYPEDGFMIGQKKDIETS
jgi:hypothetical protein